MLSMAAKLDYDSTPLLASCIASFLNGSQLGRRNDAESRLKTGAPNPRM
jgi:hypothetical protein